MSTTYQTWTAATAHEAFSTDQDYALSADGRLVHEYQLPLAMVLRHIESHAAHSVAAGEES